MLTSPDRSRSRRLIAVLAVGAAAVTASAVTATVATPGRVLALPGASESTVVAVEPTRALDTRFDVGLTGAFQSDASRKLTVTGSIATYFEPTDTREDKIVVPVGATGVVLNVTAVGPTGFGFISVRPGDATGAPSTSNINIVPGQTVPNAVTVAVPAAGSGAGQIDITFGSTAGSTVDIIVDIVGYTTNTGLIDLTNRVIALEDSGSGPQGEQGEQGDQGAQGEQGEQGVQGVQGVQAFAVTQEAGDVYEDLTDTPTAYVSVEITAPVAGQVTLNSTARVTHADLQGDVKCAIFGGTIPAVDIAIGEPSSQWFESSGPTAIDNGSLAGTRTFDIAADATVTYSLACEQAGGNGSGNDGRIAERNLTAIFTPAPLT